MEFEPDLRKYLSANLPSRFCSGPPQPRQRSELSCVGGASARTTRYSSSQVGQRNLGASDMAAMLLPNECVQVLLSSAKKLRFRAKKRYSLLRPSVRDKLLSVGGGGVPNSRFVGPG